MSACELDQLGRDYLYWKNYFPQVSLNTKYPGLEDSKRRWSSFEGS